MSATAPDVDEERQTILNTAETRGLLDAVPLLAYDYVVNAQEVEDGRIRLYLAGSGISGFVVDVAARAGWVVEGIDFERSAIVFTQGERQ